MIDETNKRQIGRNDCTQKYSFEKDTGDVNKTMVCLGFEVKVGEGGPGQEAVKRDEASTKYGDPRGACPRRVVFGAKKSVDKSCNSKTKEAKTFVDET